MNGRVNAPFPEEGQRPAAAGAQRPRVNDLLARATRAAADTPGSQATLDEVLRAAVGWRPGQHGQAYLDSVLSRPAPAPTADVPGPVMPDAGRAYRDATLAALPESPGGGHRFAFLPLSTDADGMPHLAVPGVLRDLAVGGADLLDAFANATGRTDLFGNRLPAVVTPQATLTMSALGGLGSSAEAGQALMAGGSKGGAAGASAAGSVARSGKVGYNRMVAQTPEVPQRPFAADYPGMGTDGVSGVEGGAGLGAGDPGQAAARLAFDMEGRPFVAQTVVGRQVRGGPDVAFSTPESAHADVEALSQAITGAPSRVLPGGGPVGEENMGDALGRTWPTGRTMPAEAGEAAAGRPVYQVDVAASVPEELRPSIVAHEGAGHGIDLRARLLRRMDLGPDAVRLQLFRVYDALARLDPLRAEKAAAVPAGRFANPETFDYAPHKVGEELVVEALRGYLANPNWFKTVAPDVAAQMRGIVNTDPFLSKIIQFNSAGDPIAAAGLAAAGRVGGTPGEAVRPGLRFQGWDSPAAAPPGNPALLVEPPPAAPPAAGSGAVPVADRGGAEQDGPALPPSYADMAAGYRALRVGRPIPVPPKPPSPPRYDAQGRMVI